MDLLVAHIDRDWHFASRLAPEGGARLDERRKVRIGLVRRKRKWRVLGLEPRTHRMKSPMLYRLSYTLFLRASGGVVVGRSSSKRNQSAKSRPPRCDNR